MNKIARFAPYMQPARPQPAAVSDHLWPANRLHDATPEDGRRFALSSEDARLAALAVLEDLMELHGSAHVQMLCWNLAEERRKQGRS